MSYLVLARKYRPQSFEDLAGQDHVARTLASAIHQGRIAHAFLFTGVRGVGKTTSARLLAKCLSCVGPEGTATGPTPTPCQVCAPCREIAAGADMDVQEIDGASYNGVDEVRRLQEGLAFRPARNRYKIYIVDEVHMLSNAAWNAFLKTLEEPPPHVKFIFATTEVHKVPVTILSRCQRYDFKLISAQTVASRLREVLSKEGIPADEGALAILAREAAGSMRDAMSLLDQVIAFNGEQLREDDVAKVLGVADRKVLHELAQALVKGEAAKTLDVVHALAGQGFDMTQVSKDVLRHLRNLVVAKVCGAEGRELLDLPDEELRDVLALVAEADHDDLLRLFQGFSKSYDDIARSGHPRAALEMALVRLARRPALLPLDELLVRIGELEKRLAAGAPPPRSGGSSAGPRPSGPGFPGGGGGSGVGASVSHAYSGTAGGPSGSGFVAPAWPGEPGIGDQTRGALALAPPPRPALVPPVAMPRPSTLPRPERKTDEASSRGNFDAPTSPFAPSLGGPVGASGTAGTSGGVGEGVGVGVSRLDHGHESSTPKPATPADPRVDVRDVRDVGDVDPAALAPPIPPESLEAWRAILGRLAEKKAFLASVFERAVPTSVSREKLVLGFHPESFEASQASDPEALDTLRREAIAHFGGTPEVALDLSTRHRGDRGTVAALDAQKRREEIAAARAAVAQHPMVQQAITLFGAELKEIKLPGVRDD